MLDEVALAANTAETQVLLGAPLEISAQDEAREKALLDAVAKDRKISNLKTPTTAYAAASFLRAYGSQLGVDAGGGAYCDN